MAKSTGNIARVAELLEAGVSPRALRYALISVHYRAGLQLLRRVAGGRGAPRSTGSTPLVAALGAYREDGADDPTLPDVAGRRRRRSGPRSTTT